MSLTHFYLFIFCNLMQQNHTNHMESNAAVLSHTQVFFYNFLKAQFEQSR